MLTFNCPHCGNAVYEVRRPLHVVLADNQVRSTDMRPLGAYPAPGHQTDAICPICTKHLDNSQHYLFQDGTRACELVGARKCKYRCAA